MIERKNERVYFKSRVLEDAKEVMGDNFTSEDLLEYLIEDPSYTLRSYRDSTKRTIFNRINMLWVFPLVFLSMPFQWVLTGQTGYRRGSKIGKILEFLVKFDS